MKKISAIVIVSLLLFGMFMNFEVGIENASAYTPHAPIYIDGNSDFTNQSLIEGWAGDGSQSTPYIIEGYEIDASTATGIGITNTDVYFVIRDCYIHDGGTSYNGIAFTPVSNGEIWNSHLSNNNDGIYVGPSCSNNTISNNIIESNNNWGLILGGMSNSALNNSIHSNTGDGIWLIGGSCTVLNNTISNNFNGIYSSGGLEHNVISNNRIQFNNYNGIYLDISDKNTISGNTISHNTNYGIYLDLSDDIKIYHNNITFNTNQAYDNIGNSWNLLYPGGGNYWDDYAGNDNFKGPDQDISGSDGFGDTPYSGIDGSGGAEDMYPLIRSTNATLGGDILITSHDDGEIVSGIILIEAAVTFPDVWGVNFYIDGTFMNFDDSSPYQFILDTNTISEDTSFEITAEAYLLYGSFESTSITLWVNNIVDIGSYITVSTLHPEYQPDEDVSVLVATVSPPYFETLELDVNCVDPSGHPLYTSSHDFYYSTEFRVIMPIPSDAELGTYTVTVYAYGLARGSLIWYSLNITTFLVSGTSLREELEELNLTLTNIDLTELLDAVEYLNQTLPVKIDDLSLQLSGVNESLQSDIHFVGISILDELANVNSALADDIQNLLASITSDIIGMNSSLSDELTNLLNTMTTDSTALRTWLDIVLGAIDTNLTDTRAVLEAQLGDLEDYMAGFHDSLQSDLGIIIVDIQAHDSSTGENHSDIIDMLDSIQGDIGQTGIDDLKTMLTGLTGNVSSFDQSIAADIQGVVGDINEFETGSAQRLDNISSTLDDLARWEDVLNKLEELDTDLETAEDDLSASIQKIPTEKEEGSGLTEGLLIVVIVLLIINLLALLLGRKVKSGGMEALPDEEEEPEDMDVEEAEEIEEPMEEFEE